MRKTITFLAIAGALAASSANAGSGGVRIGVFGSAGGGDLTLDGGFGSRHGSFTFQGGQVSRLPGKTQHAAPKTADERMAPLDTASRARLLLDADQATRKAFAAYQEALAHAQEKGDVSGADAVLAIPAATAPRAAIRAVGDDMSNAAAKQQDATRGTRNAYQKFTAALDDEQQLMGAAGPQAMLAAFGVESDETASPPADSAPASSDQPPPETPVDQG